MLKYFIKNKRSYSFMVGLLSIWFQSNILSQELSNFVSNEIIIQLQEDISIEEFRNTFIGTNITSVKPLSKRLNIWLCKFDQSRSYHVNLNQINEMQNIKFAQQNHFVKSRFSNDNNYNKTNSEPNDTYYNQQWSLNNIGQSGGTIDADIDAPEAWDYLNRLNVSSQSDIVVAVIDNGFDLNHEDLQFWYNLNEIPNNGIDDDNNGYIDDYNGWDAYDSDGELPVSEHGTHVAGIISAVRNNNKGIAGIAGDIKIIPIAGASNTEATVIEAYGYALEMRAQYNETNGAKGALVVVTNSSFGIDRGDPLDYPVWSAMYDELGAIGILSVAATANSNWDIDVEGDMPTSCTSNFLITVTNTTHYDIKSTYAGFGAISIDLGSPGTNIISTIPYSGYANKSGTSMATPVVTGVVASMFVSANNDFFQSYLDNPAENALKIKKYLLESVDQNTSLQNVTVSEGRVNLYNALTKVVSNGWMCDILFSENIATQILTFGQDLYGSNGFDSNLGELELPPLPPAGNFDVRFNLPIIAPSLVDIRNIDSSKITWQIELQRENSGFPVNLSWNSSLLPDGDIKLKDSFGGILVDVDMKFTNSYSIHNSAINSLVIEFDKNPILSKSITVLNGWNLISVPLVANNMLKDSLFNSSISTAFRFENGYSLSDTLNTGVGYWLKFAESDTINITGQKSSTKSIQLNPGWNMIGVFENDIDITTINSLPEGNIVSNYFEYNDGYISKNILNVGKGYWVKANATGELVFNSSTNSTNRKKVLFTENDLAQIIITDKNNKTKRLYLTKYSSEYDKYELPPLPPKGIFDVRYSDNKFVRELNAENVTILISGAEYPINIRVEGISLRLKDLFSGDLLDKTIADGSSIDITNESLNHVKMLVEEIPLSFELSQNYPNPFNPTTKIKFGLPEVANVKLIVYNVLGEKVAELVNGKMEVGYHEISFNASNLSTGVYIYRLKTANFTSTKKMLLIK